MNVTSLQYKLCSYLLFLVQVYRDFEICKGKLVLLSHTHASRNSTQRALPKEPLETVSTNPLMIGVEEHGKYLRGVPSLFVQTRGNTHLRFRPLRQAIYASMRPESFRDMQTDTKEATTIAEEFPVWKDGDVAWQCDEVAPSSEFAYLLANPGAAVATFGDLRQGDSMKHTAAVWVVALELVCYSDPDGACLLDRYLSTPGSPGGQLRPDERARHFGNHFRARCNRK